ncbi:MAG: ABC transporter substrate-binding protein [Archaeoglobales archaeon]|nr:ABC transporter substrate-binding protein [Archaeoglobales archaeon]
MRKIVLFAILWLSISCVNAGEIVVGVLGPMDVPEGYSQLKAVQLAAEEINAAGGILGNKIKVVYGDDKLKPDVGASEFRRLAEIEKAKVIIGGFSSGVMLATMEVMAETKTLFLADSSTPQASAKVAENYEKYKYWFRLQNNATTFAYDTEDMIRYLISKGYEVKKVYIIKDEHIWTEDVTKALYPILEKLGVQVVKDVKIPRGYSEFEKLIIEAEKLDADLIIPILALTGTDDVLVKQWATLKPKILLAGHTITAIDADFYERTNGAANYLIFSAHGGVVVTSPPTQMCKHFIEAYRSKYGKYPEAHQAYGAYDALYLYKTAVENAFKAGEKDPFDPEVVVKYLEMFNESNPIELTRKIAFTSNHDLAWGDKYVKNWVSQWQDGKQYILYPEKMATAELKLPPWFKEEKKTPGFELLLAMIAIVAVALRLRG